jgi:molybdopterin molybdotransferase
MVEATETVGARVRLTKPVKAGENVRRAGEDLRAGDRVLGPGTPLGPAELGVLASVQHASVLVARRPEVAILVTGDELRDLHQPLDAGAIADTNSYALDALVREAGGRPHVLPIVRDDPAILRRAIEDARTSDLIVSSGGVSVGEHDYVKPVLAEMGAQLDFWRVDMKPGKPVAVARLGAVPYFGLPGNPVSTMVSFLLFVRPAIRAALGIEPATDLPRADAVLDRPLRSRGDRRNYLRARVRFDSGQLRAVPVEKQGSHQLTSMVGANALIVLPAGPHDLQAGATVPVLLIAPLV